VCSSDLTTLHVGVMAGGTALNIVPERAAMTFEARLIAADRLDDIAAQIAALAGRITMGVAAQFPDCGIEVREFNRYPGLASNPQSPGIAVFAECLPIGTETCKLSYGTEGGLFAERLGVPVVVCGPGDMAQGHQPDEFIETSELAACDAMLVRVTDRFCTA
jgi:acetylornithine deacetylase